MNTDTKFFISESLFKLLKSKELNDISIIEVVKLSNISRTTFYNNFNNLNEVIDYKLNLLIEDINKIYQLNKLRNKDLDTLLEEIFNYINNNKNIFKIIKDKLFFLFKEKLDNYFSNNLDKYEYYKISGILINLSLYYINNNFKFNLKK